MLRVARLAGTPGRHDEIIDYALGESGQDFSPADVLLLLGSLREAGSKTPPVRRIGSNEEWIRRASLDQHVGLTDLTASQTVRARLVRTFLLSHADVVSPSEAVRLIEMVVGGNTELDHQSELQDEIALAFAYARTAPVSPVDIRVLLHGVDSPLVRYRILDDYLRRGALQEPKALTFNLYGLLERQLSSSVDDRIALFKTYVRLFVGPLSGPEVLHQMIKRHFSEEQRNDVLWVFRLAHEFRSRR